MPDVAVVMPVRNREATVGRAVASVLNQDHADFELIVVDDASDDASAAAVLACADPRIRLFRQDRNRGAGAARNRGIEEAKAPLIAFLDSDDEFGPQKLGYLVRYFACHSRIDVLIDSFEVSRPPGRGRARQRRINRVLDSSAEIERAVLERRIFKATPAISARKPALLAAGLFDETLKRRQDFDLVLRLTRMARCATTDAVLWTKHWSPDAISATDTTFAAALVDLCRRHPRCLTDPAARPGLARDVARHFLRLAVHGRLGVAVGDARCLGREFGVTTLAGLIQHGLGEMLRREREKRDRRRQAGSL